ncbi:hypothetical protein [Paraliomyxa miuraensis]|uniref:hypothetical protein n=1 Tax=Paraliomyxa miuraensis TaxID=376150 RepID=UPI0022569270|nr:hypothetical protein [Paraliomyxa miuraensis]MCX4245913.1 hypothetical protein [Paraliomyxa miuraensis]
MMRQPFPGHRRYSITHRAVQRLRELVPSRDDEDDESLRDRLDEALGAAEDAGKAIRTLDAMLGEPQTLVPVDTFGDVLYAIIKEDTVVTVLPEGHGQEILQRGQAMEQRMAAGQASAARSPAAAPPESEERWEGGPRRRWRKEPHQPVVIQRIARNGHAPTGRDGHGRDDLRDAVTGAPIASVAPVTLVPELSSVADDDPIARELQLALDRGRRRAVVVALSEVLSRTDRDDSLLPLWNTLASQGVPSTLTVGDLIDAVRSADGA